MRPARRGEATNLSPSDSSAALRRKPYCASHRQWQNTNVVAVGRFCCVAQEALLCAPQKHGDAGDGLFLGGQLPFLFGWPTSSLSLCHGPQETSWGFGASMCARSITDVLSGAFVEHVSRHQVQPLLGDILGLTLMPAFVFDSAEGVWPRPL